MKNYRKIRNTLQNFMGTAVILKKMQLNGLQQLKSSETNRLNTNRYSRPENMQEKSVQLESWPDDNPKRLEQNSTRIKKVWNQRKAFEESTQFCT